MQSYEAVLRMLIEAVQANESLENKTEDSKEIPVGISNRHVHLSEPDMKSLFGEDYKMAKLKDLSQPNQYACKETVTICGPKGAIEKVRVLGPTRSKTQVEVLLGDSYKLGLVPQIRISGDLHGTPGITLVGPKGSVQIKEGLVVAQRHIHMNCEDAKRLGVKDGEVVSIEVDGERGGVYSNVAIRANDSSLLEFHVDTEEANAMYINSLSKIKIKK